MKKLTLIIINLCISIYVFGQTTDIMTIVLPTGSEKLTEQQYDTFLNTHFSSKVIHHYTNNVYKNGDIIFSYDNLSVQPLFKRSLEAAQIEFTSLNKNMGKKVIIDSKIATYNNIRFCIIEYYRDNDYTIQFFSDYDNKLRFINGQVLFNKKDQTGAHQYLESILQNVHFTNN